MMKNLFLLVITLSLFTMSSSYAQVPTSKNDNLIASYQSTKNLVQYKQYQFVGEAVYNDSGRAIVKAENNKITINEDKAAVRLTSMDASKNIISSDGTLLNYAVTFKDSSKEVNITFTLEQRDYSITVKPNGNAFLEVKQGNSIIKQLGRLKTLE